MSCISLILCALKSLQNEILLFLCSYLPRLNIPICHPSKLSTFCCQQSACPFRPSVPEGFLLWPDPIFRSANQQLASHLSSRNSEIWPCNFCRYIFVLSSKSRLKQKIIKLSKMILTGLNKKRIERFIQGYHITSTCIKTLFHLFPSDKLSNLFELVITECLCCFSCYFSISYSILCHPLWNVNTDLGNFNSHFYILVYQQVKITLL